MNDDTSNLPLDATAWVTAEAPNAHKGGGAVPAADVTHAIGAIDVTTAASAPSRLTVQQYADGLKLDASWLRGTFGLKDYAQGSLTGVEIPYRQFAAEPFGRYRLTPDKDECSLRIDEANPVTHGVYGLDLLEHYKGETVWVGLDEADVFAGRYHDLQVVAVPRRHGIELLGEVVPKVGGVRRLIVVVPDAEDLSAEQLARPLKESGWPGEVGVVVLSSAPGAEDLYRLHVSLDGDREKFAAEIARMGAAATLVDPPVPNKLTDCGNAKRFVEQHGRDLRYLVEHGRWLAWDGRRWATCDTGEEQRRAKLTAKSIYLEAARSFDNSKALAAWATRSESVQHVEAMIKLARSERGISIRAKDLDPDAYLLNVENGTVDLRTGELRPHRREDLISRLCPVAYDPAATCPTWDGLLDTVTGGNAALQAYLRRAVGYTLTGDTGEECLFFAYGDGKNGKSTFTETLFALLGDYAAKTSAESLMTRRSGGVPNDIARLNGPRYVLASELDENRRWSEPMVKDLTGNDTIPARFLHREFFEFKPRFKIWCFGNHKPNVGGTDTGFWRRMRVLPFTVTIPEARRVSRTTLDRQLKAEWPGILAWAVRGCLEWQRSGGLGTCPEVERQTQEYREESDVLADFLDERCVLQHNVRIKVMSLYKAYAQWAADSGQHYVWDKLAFGKRLREKGYETKKSNGEQRWLGLTTKDPANWESRGRRDEALSGYATPPADPEDPMPPDSTPSPRKRTPPAFEEPATPDDPERGGTV